jgi:hypothetical protein
LFDNNNFYIIVNNSDSWCVVLKWCLIKIGNFSSMASVAGLSEQLHDILLWIRRPEVYLGFFSKEDLEGGPFQNPCLNTLLMKTFWCSADYIVSLWWERNVAGHNLSTTASNKQSNITCAWPNIWFQSTMIFILFSLFHLLSLHH